MNDLLNAMKMNKQVEKMILVKGKYVETYEIYAQLRRNNEIFIPDTSIQVDAGDTISRNLLNGVTEKYNIDNVKYNKSVSIGIPDTYLCETTKMS